MSQNIIYKNGEDEVLVPLNQSIAINSSFGGITKVYYLISVPNNPPVYKLQTTLLNSNTILGPMSRDTFVKIEPGNATVFYDVGITPNTGVGDADTIGGYEPDITDEPSTVVIRDTFGNIEATAFESTVATGTAPLTVASTTLVTNLNADLLDGIDSTTASTPTSIAVRDFNGDITANVMISDVATGTAPLTVASTTMVTNLNADMVDSIQGANIMVNNADNTTTGDITISNATPSLFLQETDDSSNQAEIGRDGTYLYIRNEDIRITDSSGGDISSFTIRTGGAYNTIWHAGNDGPGSGLDADTLDTVEASSFLRSNTADDVAGVLTFTVGPLLNNNIYLDCKETGATTRNVFGMDTSNILNVGNVNNALNLRSNGTLTHNGSPLSILASWEENGNNFRPTSSGVGNLGDTTHLIAGIYMGDNAYAYFGDDQDMQLHHNGVNGVFYVGNGDLYIGTVDADNLILTTNNTVRWIVDSSGDISPYVSSTYNIGSSTYRINDIYGDFANFQYGFGVLTDGYGITFGAGSDASISFNGSYFVLNSNRSIEFKINGTTIWLISYLSGCLQPSGNKNYDIGIPSSNEVDQIYCDAVNESSDVRLKENIDTTFLGLDFINNLNPIVYNFKDRKNKRKHGFSAQAVLEVIEKMGYSIEDFGAISHVNDGWSLNYSQFIAPIIKAIQEIDRKVEDALL
jgi:hypothetical protein